MRYAGLPSLIFHLATLTSTGGTQWSYETEPALFIAAYVLYVYSKENTSWPTATFRSTPFTKNPGLLLLVLAVLNCPREMRKHSLVGNWLRFTGQAECVRPAVTNSLHCHPGSIVRIVTQNQTHTRGRRLIGCTLEHFYPPLHMTTEIANLWYFPHKALYTHPGF